MLELSGCVSMAFSLRRVHLHIDWREWYRQSSVYLSWDTSGSHAVFCKQILYNSGVQYAAVDVLELSGCVSMAFFFQKGAPAHWLEGVV